MTSNGGRVGSAPGSGRVRLLTIIGLVAVLHATALWRADYHLPDRRLSANAVPAFSVRMIAAAAPVAAPVAVQFAWPVVEAAGSSAAESVDTQAAVVAETQPTVSSASRNEPPAAAGSKLPARVTAPGDERAGDRSTLAAVASAASGALDPTASSPPVASLLPPLPQLPPATDYLSGLRLDPGPQPLGDIEPLYPDEANAQSGYVVLRVLINEAGAVDNVAVVRSYPRGLFEASALQAFGHARFAPGKLLGLAVKSQMTIEVQFTPINQGAKPTRSY